MIPDAGRATVGAARPTVAPPLLESHGGPSPSGPVMTPSELGPLTTDELVVDGSRRQQTMSGIGVNANVHSWKGGQLKPAIDRYAALGAVTWRVIVERADWEPTQVGDPATIDASYYRGIFESPKMTDLWNTIAYIESKPNQTVSLSVMGGVSDWMGGAKILPSKEDYWVRMIAALLQYGRQAKGLDLKLISPLNEPDLTGIEGPSVDPRQMASLLEKLVRRLDSLGMGDVQLVIPDTAGAEAAKNSYLPALLGNGTVAARIGRVGIHSYTGDAAGVPAFLQDTLGAGTSVWATEFNAPCDGCDTGAPPGDSGAHAIAMARTFLALVDKGVAGGQLYDAWDGYYEHHGATGYWGALEYVPSNGTYTPRPEFGVLSLMIRGVHPGVIHLASDGAQAVESEAFLDPNSGEVTVIGANATESAQRFQVRVTRARRFAGADLRLAVSGSSSITSQHLSANNDVVILALPPGSVFTLTSAS